MPGHAPGRSDPPVPEKGRALAPRSPGPLQALPLLRLRLGRLLLPGGRSGAPAGGVGSSGASQQGPYLGVLGRVIPAARVVGGSVSWTLLVWSPHCLAGCRSGSEAALGSLLSPPRQGSREAPAGHVPLMLGMYHML